MEFKACLLVAVCLQNYRNSQGTLFTKLVEFLSDSIVLYVYCVSLTLKKPLYCNFKTFAISIMYSNIFIAKIFSLSQTCLGLNFFILVLEEAALRFYPKAHCIQNLNEPYHTVHTCIDLMLFSTE